MSHGRGAHRLVAATLTAALALVGTGCGIPRDDRPTVVADRDVPFGLLERPAPTPVSQSTSSAVPPA